MDYFSGLKILKHSEKIRELLETGDSSPIMAEIDPTDACNFNCPWCCDRELHQKFRSLPKERAFSLIDELCERNLKSVVIKGGGEPTLSPYLSEYLRYIRRRGLDIGIITNGSNITSELTDTICSTTTWIKVSLDAATEETHTKMHRPKSGNVFNEILGNIKFLVHARTLASNSIAIGINFTINETNYKEIVEAAELAKNLGVDYILLKFMVFEKRGIDGERFRSSENKVRKSIVEAKKLSSGSFSVIFRDIRDADKGWNKCLFNPFITTTCASGDVYPCCHTKGREEFCYGNFLDKSFWDVWDGERRKQIYQKVRNKACFKYCSFRYTPHNRILNYLAKEQPHTNFI